MQLQLPDPGLDALMASRALQTLIANDIRHNSGWIPFSRFMELALYAPGLGYYSGGAAKLGRDGDFTTAPEMSPLFGQTLAHVVADLIGKTTPQIMEFGAGTGKLARDMLTELAAMGVAVHRYSIVELSGELRARQQQTLRGFPQVTWLDQFPAVYSGVVLGNEVLDAMPVQLVVKTAQGWRERGIGLAPKKFVYRDRPCDPALLAQIPQADLLPEGYLTEVHPIALGFVRTLADMLRAGFDYTGYGGAALLIDYGFPAHEYYLPQRAEGTLMCHYRHHSHPDPFYLPGLQDITAHVDFSAMARAAEQGGAEVYGFTTQAYFLISCGLAVLVSAGDPTVTLSRVPHSGQRRWATRRPSASIQMRSSCKSLESHSRHRINGSMGSS